MILSARVGPMNQFLASIGIDGGRVEWVGRDTAAPASQRTIDAKGGFAVPGFIDNHVHLRGGREGSHDEVWAETFASGQALRGQAGNSGFGLVQSGALEGANVDVTEQLVNMITAQRNFQANAQMISTADQITQTIMQIR